MGLAVDVPATVSQMMYEATVLKSALLTITLLYIAFKVYSIIVCTYQIRVRYQDIPQLPRHPIWGNVVNIGRKIDPVAPRHMDYGLAEAWDDLGRPPAYLMDFNPISLAFLIIADPEVADQIVSPSPQYKYSCPKSITYSATRPLLGQESLNIQEGETWRALRRRFNAGFQPSYLHTLVPIIASHTATFIDRLKEAAKSGEMIILADYAKDLTADVIIRLSIESDINAQSTPEGEGEKGRLGILTASRRLSSLVYKDGSGFNPLYYLDPVRPTKCWFYEKLLDIKVSNLVGKEFFQPGSRNDPEKVRSISQLAVAGLPKTSAVVRNTVHQVKSFLFAGQDTTATLIQWMCYNMSKASHSPHHAKILRKLRNEHDAVFGDSSPWSALTIFSSTGADAASKLGAASNTHGQLLSTSLPYTTAFIKENLRLYPPGSTARRVPSDTPYWVTIDKNKPPVRIDGLAVYVNHFLIHRNRTVWGEDADVFDPDRWLDSAKMAKLPQGAWRPFEKGPRNCIGQELALIEAKVVLCAVARGFDWEKVGYDGSEEFVREDSTSSGDIDMNGHAHKRSPEKGSQYLQGMGDETPRWGKRKKTPGHDLKDLSQELWSKYELTSVPYDGMKMRVKWAR